MRKAILIPALLVAGAVATMISVFMLADSTSGWFARYIAMISLGTVLALGELFSATPRLLRAIAVLPYCSPNWLSIWRLPIIWVGQIVFCSANGRLSWLIAGALIIAQGLIMDRIDGKMASAVIKSIVFLLEKIDSALTTPFTMHAPWAWYAVEEENEEGKVLVDRRIRLEGWIVSLSRTYTRMPMFTIEADNKGIRVALTRIGEWLDPLVDKGNFLPFFCYLASQRLLLWWVVMPMVAVDICGTILREPFIELRRFSWLKRYIRQAKASPFGKTKLLLQVLTLLTVMPAAAGWLDSNQLCISLVITDVALGLAALAGLMSVISRLTLMDVVLDQLRIRKLYKSFHNSYEHDDSED